MQVTITGRHLDLTEAIKQRVDNDVRRVVAHVGEVTDVSVVLVVEKLEKIAEVTMSIPGNSLHATHSSQDLYQSVDGALAKVEKQILKSRDRKIARKSRDRTSAH